MGDLQKQRLLCRSLRPACVTVMAFPLLYSGIRFGAVCQLLTTADNHLSPATRLKRFPPTQIKTTYFQPWLTWSSTSTISSSLSSLRSSKLNPRFVSSPRCKFWATKMNLRTLQFRCSYFRPRNTKLVNFRFCLEHRKSLQFL